MERKGRKFIVNTKQWFFFISIAISVLWLAEAIFLFMKGINLFVSPHMTSSGVVSWLATFLSKRQDAIYLLLAVGFMISYFQGKYLFSRFIQRILKTIQMQKFPVKEVLFFLSWAFIGAGLQLFAPEDFCGWLDFTIGASLLNSVSFYWKGLFSLRKETT
jgi:hypothetical protein